MISLDDRMKEAGMTPLSEMLTSIPAGRFLAHAGVKDLPSFEAWIKMRREEFLRLQSSMELDKQQQNELYEWVVAHAAVFTEVLCNLQCALGKNPTAIEKTEVECLSGNISGTTNDMAMLIKQLIHSLNKAHPNHPTAARANDYLNRHGLMGSPLR